MSSLTVVIVEKSGELKSLSIKEFKEEDLFKKCGFKKAEGFKKHTEWSVKYPHGSTGKKYYVSVYAKDDGRANNENKYDFPPPIDTKLFFGNCVLVARLKEDDGKYAYTNLTIDLWEKLYEKLFGGFEDLAATALEDENEEDELENVPKHKKTKQGYLKDGFVVDSSDLEDEDSGDDHYETESDEYDNNHKKKANNLFASTEEEEDDFLEDIGSELSEDKYDYSDEE